MALRDREKQDIDTDTSDPEVMKRYEGTGVTPMMFVLAVIAVALVVLLAQNTDPVDFRFLTFDSEVPLYVLFLITGVVSAIATLAASGLWRRRRRRVRNEREELARLRRH